MCYFRAMPPTADTKKKFHSGPLADIARVVSQEIAARWPSAAGKYATVIQVTRGGLVMKVFPSQSSKGGERSL